jgi:branched-chain amino acid transport system permease protein
MELFVAQVINGLAVGSIYALLAVGINLISLIKGVFHYSYPHIAVFSMYICWMVLRLTNNNLALAIPATIIGAILLVTLTEPLFRPIARPETQTETIILALGIGMILTEIMSHNLHQGMTVVFPSTIVGGGGRLQAGLISISLGHIYSIIGSIAAVIALVYFLFRHKLGRAFRAIAQDPGTARLLGIPITKSGIYSFSIAGLLAGIIAIFLIMNLGAASASLGDYLALKGFVVVIVAGNGNLKGGIICGLAIGLAEALAQAYLPGRWTDSIVFGAIMMALMIRPLGLFGPRA